MFSASPCAFSAFPCAFFAFQSWKTVAVATGNAQKPGAVDGVEITAVHVHSIGISLIGFHCLSLYFYCLSVLNNDGPFSTTTGGTGVDMRGKNSGVSVRTQLYFRCRCHFHCRCLSFAVAVFDAALLSLSLPFAFAAFPRCGMRGLSLPFVRWQPLLRHCLSSYFTAFHRGTAALSTGFLCLVVR